MGSTSWQSDEERVHSVTVDGFYMHPNGTIPVG